MSTAVFWRKFDALFEEMDKFFKQMDDLFDEAKSVNSNVHAENSDEHKVRFRAQTWRERFRWTGRFFWMTITMLFTSQSDITFRRRGAVK